MRRYFLLTTLFLTFSVSAQDLTQQRWLFNSAYQAVQSKNWDTFFQLSTQLKDYPLYYFLQYHYLNTQLKEIPASQLQAFLKQYGQTAFGEKLRQQWLYQLGTQRNWGDFLQAYTPQKTTALQCYYAQARLETGQQTQAALQDIQALWLVGKSQDNTCNPAFEHLYRSHLMNDQVVWQRIGLLMDKGNIQLADVIAKRLSPAQQGWMAQWQAVHAKPAQMLETFSAPDTPLTHDIVAHGIKRLAKQDFSTAKAFWLSSQQRYHFSAQKQGEVQQALAFASLEQNHPEAVSWLKTIPIAYINEELDELRLNFALQRQDWQALADFTTHNPIDKENNLRWRYWHARGLEQTGQQTQAQSLFKELAKERDYYGFLAANRINANYSMQNNPITFTPVEEKQLLENLSIRAAYEFYQKGMLQEGRIEWSHALDSLSPRQQAVAAALAHRWQWYDRAIATAAKANLYDAVDIRFPLPYRANLTTGAKNQGLDLAWVYGIVRQESIFMADARSRSGALGLMQLMPATGRMVARQLGLTINSNQDILDIDTNISLGTTYLQQMLGRFGGNYMLATAAYNAGPGRAKRWSEELGCLPADVWVELIPFSETKTYVRRVLFYTAVFENRLGQPQRPVRITTARADCAFRSVNYP